MELKHQYWLSCKEKCLLDIDWQGADQIKNKRLDYKLVTFLLHQVKILFDRLSNRDMKDKLIVDERMQQFERDVLHWFITIMLLLMMI